MRWFIATLLLAAPAAAQPTALDLNARIKAQCAKGYVGQPGCTIELSQGAFAVASTIKVGDCTTLGAREAVRIVGQGAGMYATGTGKHLPMAATSLKWVGPKGGIMFDACGAGRFELSNLALDAHGADAAVRLSADQDRSSISHFVHFEALNIAGGRIGIHVTGTANNAQVDFVTLERVSITDVEIGYLQESQQSVGGSLRTVEVVSRGAGYVIRAGSLDCDGCYVGNLPRAGGYDPAFIGFHLTGVKPPANLRQQVSIRDSHMELRSGRHIVEDVGAGFPILSQGNTFLLQCQTPGCEQTVIDSQARGPVTMISDVITGSGGAGSSKARVCQRNAPLHAIGVHPAANLSAMSWECVR